MFVVDDFAAWMVAALADASRRRLVTTVLGTDQERALSSAAKTAVQLTASELSLSSGNRADVLEMVINHVFAGSVPVESPSGATTLLEALQIGIAKQLTPLDDSSLTGIGKSSAELLEISSSLLAETLSRHFVREIVTRATEGGPLAPLAAQLNHDVTHLQGRRLEGIIGQLVEQLQDGMSRPSPSLARSSHELGMPVRELTDPIALMVHPVIDVPNAPSRIPEYLRREHDEQLEVALSASRDNPIMVVLVGSSSTGKTQDALRRWAGLLARSGEMSRAKEFLLRASVNGDSAALWWLANSLWDIGEREESEEYYVGAANAGCWPDVAREWSERLVAMKENERADRLSRFGLTCDGRISDPWDLTESR